MAAIDMAAWDVLAKSAELSLIRLLGGEEKPVRPTTALAWLGQTGGTRSSRIDQLGFRCVKLKLVIRTWNKTEP